MNENFLKLCSACREGNATRFAALLLAGADPNGHNAKNHTPAMIASENGKVSCLKRLIEAGADIAARGDANETALTLAAFAGKARCVELLIHSGAGLEDRGHRGQTPFMLAVSSENLPCVKLLLKAGCDVDAGDYSNTTPLMLAAHSGHPKIVELILKAGANLHAVSESKSTAALYSAFGSPECTRLLIDAGADFLARDHFGTSALIAAASKGHGHTLEMLIELGKKTPQSQWLDLSNQNGITAVMAACARTDAHSLQVLIDAGADVNILINSPLTRPRSFPPTACVSATMIAVQMGFDEGLTMLIRAGADLDACDDSGSTAAMRCSSDGNPSTLALLIEAGANLDVVNLNGATAESLAAGMSYHPGHAQCAAMIQAHKERDTLRSALGDALLPISLPLRV